MKKRCQKLMQDQYQKDQVFDLVIRFFVFDSTFEIWPKNTFCLILADLGRESAPSRGFRLAGHPWAERWYRYALSVGLENFKEKVEGIE